MPSTLNDDDWDELLKLIADGKCTPFIGAGAAGSVLPLASGFRMEVALA